MPEPARDNALLSVTLDVNDTMTVEAILERCNVLPVAAMTDHPATTYLRTNPAGSDQAETVVPR